MELMRSAGLGANFGKNYYYIDGKKVSRPKYDEALNKIIHNHSYSASGTKILNDRVRHYCSGRA